MKKSRLTVDMNGEDHKYLKMACAKMGVSMRDFIIKAAMEKIDELEDQWWAERADKLMEDVESGKEEVFEWEEVKKNLDTVNSQKRENPDCD